MSLVYRIARSFHFKFSLEIESIDIYLVNIRRFILESLSGIVLNSDFQALEVQLLNPQFNFGFILQRMWAFRGFRLARVPRAMCDIWFSAWTSSGYEYDIATFEDWNFDFENLKVDFDQENVVIPKPELSNIQKLLLNYFGQFLGDPEASFDISLTILSFDSTQWDGKFVSLIRIFENNGEVPKFLLYPDFDNVMMRLRIVYEIETSSVQENCPGAIENLLARRSMKTDLPRG